MEKKYLTIEKNMNNETKKGIIETIMNLLEGGNSATILETLQSLKG